MHISLIYTESDKWAFGLRSISASLKKAGHNTRLIFMGTEDRFYTLPALQVLSELVEESSIVGISSMANGSDRAKQIIESLKPLGKLTVWGGIHATLNPEECAQSADIICVGEGEEFMTELATRLEQGMDWRTMAGVFARNKNGIVSGSVRPLIGNLDQLPLFDFDFDDEYRLEKASLTKTTNDSYIPGEPIHFSGARGCAFHCNYCSNGKLKKIFAGHGTYVRRISVSKYIEHAKALKQRFPKAKSFYLLDEDLFARGLDDIKEFAERFPSEVGLPFECMASPPQISQEKVELFTKAGLWRIGIGVESGSERTKKHVFNRPITNKMVMRAASILSKYPQIVTYYFIIMGNPYEDREDLMETIRLLKSLPYPFYLKTYSLVFFPNTLLYEKALSDGIIAGKEDSGYDTDFLAGLKLNGPDWKKQNLYLNGLIYLMAGKSNGYRVGFLPRIALNALLHRVIMNHNDTFPFFIKFMIRLKGFVMSIRTKTANIVKKIFNDPTVIYGPSGASALKVSLRISCNKKINH